MIDSEWQGNYISPSELDTLLEFSEKQDSRLKTIITISARHICSVERARKLTGIMKKHENVGLNLVAGNRAYLAAAQ